MPCQARRTKGVSGQPLLMTFHGTGGDENQFHPLARRLLPNAHVTSPRGDVSERGALRYFARSGEGVYDMDDLAERRTAMAQFIVNERQMLGQPRTIGLGYSNGANILMAVALERPDLFNDLVLMHPLIPWQPSPVPGLAGRRILVTAGRADPICPASETERLAAFLTEQGAVVTEHWHESGHEIADSEIVALQKFLAA